MNLDSLIQEAEDLKSKSEPSGFGVGRVIPLEDLERWVTKVNIYANNHLEDVFLFTKIKENSTGLERDGHRKFTSILGILKGIKESQ